MPGSLHQMLDLQHAPVAIAFRDAAPAGMKRVESAGPSGCSYWKRAADGEAFYTEASDHHGCPIGSFTHGIELPPEKMQELQGLIGTMAGLGYLDPAEVPSIPRRTERFGVALYAPWPTTAFTPDVVLVRCNARQAMILSEAIAKAGGAAIGEPMLRPTCALLPRVAQAGQAGLSFACIGNRVYTGLGDGEIYVAIAGARAGEVLAKVGALVDANRELEKFHRSRLQTA
jgi:uncharacterized protein (DUF169 family)